MDSGGLFVLGGLLGGAGQAITNNANANREAALAALKRQYEVEDRDKASADKLEQLRETLNGRQAIVDTTVAGNLAVQNARTQGEASNIRLRADLDLRNNKNLKAIEQAYDLTKIQAQSLADFEKEARLNHNTPDHYEKTANGQIIIWNKDGSTRGVIGADGMFVPPGSGNDDGGGSITGTQAQRGQGNAPPKSTAAPATKAPAKANGDVPGQRGAALASMGNLYAKLASGDAKTLAEARQKYPAMFDASGKLKPKDELISMINQRYQ